MSDIVERLRDNADLDAAEHVPAYVVQMQYDAADEIEHLRAEVARQKEVISSVNKRCDHLGISLGEIKRERDTLRSEIEVLRTHRSAFEELIRVKEENETLQLALDTERQAATLYAKQVAHWIEKHDTLRKDADRYRFLSMERRDYDMRFLVLDEIDWLSAGGCEPTFFKNSDALSAAIDAAMKECGRISA